MKGDDHWEKIILMVFFCFSLSAISVADAGQKQHDETKVSQQIFDRFMHQLFSKEILENVRGIIKIIQCPLPFKMVLSYQKTAKGTT